MDFKERLAGRGRDEYGENYDAHALDIYKTYLGLTYQIGTRRQNGIVKLTKICVIDPQDIVVDAHRGSTCWVSEPA